MTGLFYFAIENLDDGFIMRSSTSLVSGGALCPDGVFLSPNAHYRQFVFQASTGLVGVSDFTTPSSGVDFTMPEIILGQDTSPDSDGDGLRDMAEFIVGTSASSTDTNHDGISDGAAIQNGLDPLGGVAFPTGVIASLQLLGEAKAITLTGSTSSQGGQTAYIATGSYGLAIVNASRFDKPVVQGQIALSGNSMDVAVDTADNLAIVASGPGGVNIVDVSDPTSPILKQTIKLPSGAQVVAFFDGLAYVASGASINSIDPLTGEIQDALNLHGGQITGFAREGSILYTMDTQNNLRAIDISGFGMTLRGSLVTPDGGGQLFVTSGIAYIAAVSNFRGGFDTVNVSNPDALTLISGANSNQTNVLANTAIVPNGSGLGVLVGTPPRSTTGPVLELMDLSDPTNTMAFVTLFNLPTSPLNVAIASGIAYVAGGSGGLQVVNYQSFDNKGLAPLVSITSPVADADPNTTGVQVVEGGSIPIQLSVGDDVQVRDVALLVNGQVVADKVSLPFDFTATVPAIATAGTTLTIQVRATDTGGNTTLSNVLTYSVIPDTIPPQVVGTTPTSGSSVFFTPSIDVRFDKALDPAVLNASGVSLVFLGADGVVGGGDDVTVSIASIGLHTLGHRLSIYPTTVLDTGKYQLSLDPSVIADGAGNHLASAFTLQFNIRPASDIHPTQGFPAIQRAPAANVGQEIGFHIPGADSNTKVTFPTVDYNGTAGSLAVPPSRIDAATQIAYFIVPATATTGDLTINISDTDFPIPLQIVPTLSYVHADNSVYHGQNIVFEGSAFMAGATTVNFGTVSVSGTGSVYYDTYNNYYPNGLFTVKVPDGADFGPITITTAGGTSEAFPLTFTQIEGTATSGTPADGSQASANPAQAITLNGTGFDLNTAVVFQAIDINGTRYEHVVKPIAIAPEGTKLIVVVPDDAVTGTVSVVGDQLNTAILLQIVPVVRYADFTSVSGDGSSAAGLIRGSGFVEGAGTYTFATTSIVDNNTQSGPDVYYDTSAGYRLNGQVGLTVPLNGNAYGAVTVTTAGGTSAPFTVGFSKIQSTAYSGTPADSSQASANSGQVVTIVGSGLSTGTGVVAQYVDINGTNVTELLHPFYTDVTGQLAEVAVPNYYNGAFVVHIVGTSTAPLLQIVPQATSVYMSGVAQAQIQGYGFIEGNGSVYSFNGVTVVDTSVSSGPDVYYNPNNGYVSNALVYLTPPTSGPGLLTVTTPGGTSAPIAWNVINPNSGPLSDVAVDPSSGAVYVSLYNGNQIQRINPSAGAAIGSPLALPGGSSYGLTGLQILGQAITLAGVSVPAGSLLVTDGYANPDRVDAINPSTGAVLASLILHDNLDANAGVYDAASGKLYLLRGTTNKVAVVDAQSGATLSQFATPAGVDYWNGGLALDPTTADLWLGSATSNVIARVSKTDGSVLESVDLAPQGVTGIAGLSFNSAGQLLVASSTGAVMVVSAAGLPAPATPALAGITSSADSGTPASTGQASANVAQTIELTGTGLTASTGIIFATRDNNGNVGTVTVYAKAVNDAGTQMQVVVPDLAQSGNVTLAGGTGSVLLQVVPTLTGISGLPGTDSAISVYGSGFMNAAQTITIAGLNRVNQYTNQGDPTISGTRNDTLSGIVMPTAVESTIRVTTAGGYAELTIPAASLPSFVEFNALNATAAAGTPANSSVASAVVGQSITLVGRGFNNGTLVQFAAEDQTGSLGVLTRTGVAAAGGTLLTVVVPAQAVSGVLHVVGASGSFALQIVPTLRSVGGAVTAGGPIVIEGTGLAAGELQVSIGGQSVTLSPGSVHALFADGISQQVVDLTVPSGIANGQIIVTTSGGTFTLHTGVTPATLPGLAPATDPGDTLPTAVDLGLTEDSQISVGQQIGDGADGSNDVDLYSFTASGGDQVTVKTVPGSSSPYPYVRLFDAAGHQLAIGYYYQSPAIGYFVLPSSGTYYVGVSSYNNASYDPTQADSGKNGSYTGAYTLTVSLVSAGSTSVSSISGAAGSGTAARSSLPSANAGQTITLSGVGFQPGDQVAFEYVDLNNSAVGWTVVTPTSVASDGKSLQVVVPAAAVSGTVRLVREQVGLFVQIVPTLSYVSENSSAYHDQSLTVTGSGFIEAGTTINYGGQSQSDDGPNNGPDVYYDSSNAYLYDGSVTLRVPNGMPYGPITVTTFGGTSTAFPLTFTQIEGTATSGTAADGSQASANPEQTITLDGTSFDKNTTVVFQAIDINGTRYEHAVKPKTVASDGTQLTLVVPDDALTGPVSVVGDRLNTASLLQIVPVVTSAFMSGVGQAQIVGLGFIEGNGSAYSFDGVAVVDTSTSSGPDVYYNVYNGYLPNGLVYLAPPTSGAGALTVTTAGGTSAPFVWNAIELNLGALSDVASDPNTGALYVSLYNTNVIQQIDPNTGVAIGSAIALPGGSSYGLTGLQILTQAITLAGVSVPAGSLLVTDGYYNPDRVDAINPSTGAVLATLILHDNLDANAGVYDTATGRLYLLRGSANQVAVVDAQSGVTLSQFATPAEVDYGNGGLAIGPVSGDIWLGSATSTVVSRVSKVDGTVLESVDLKSQGVTGIAGLSFNAAGQLLAASTTGVVYVANVGTQAQFALAPERAASPRDPLQARGLTMRDLNRVVDAAIAQWAAAGISEAQLHKLDQIAFRIMDLPGAYLGLETPGSVLIDRNADACGWFIDATPRDNSEFAASGEGGALVASSGSPAWGRMDLLTVVTHELGHELGLDDDDGHGLMGEFLPVGTRRLPFPLVAPSSFPEPGVASLPAGRSGPTAIAVDQLFQGMWIAPAGWSQNSSVNPAANVARITRPPGMFLRASNGPYKPQAIAGPSQSPISSLGEPSQEESTGLRTRVKRALPYLFE